MSSIRYQTQDIEKNMKRIIPVWFVVLLTLSSAAYSQDQAVLDLIDRLGIRESALASRDMPGWSKPTKITILSFRAVPDTGPGSLVWMQEVAGGVDIEILSGVEMDTNQGRLAESEVILGWCFTDMLEIGKSLNYLHIFFAGIDHCMDIPGIRESDLNVTNSAKAASETIAETSIALMFMLTRNLHFFHTEQLKSNWARNGPSTSEAIMVEGKTMLVLGLGGIGSQVAKRAHALGMRVIGTRNSSRSGPDYVDYVGLSDEMLDLASQADVVVNALPLTDTTKGIVNADFFKAMKDKSYYVSVGRGGTTDTTALTTALKDGKLAGAGLDVTDPEPLPAEHELWLLPNVIITPHTATHSDVSRLNTQLIARENLRRYIRGEHLLNQVDMKRGY
jgi:D-2-hydroxyacid dehydrogenase (NADP+)